MKNIAYSLLLLLLLSGCNNTEQDQNPTGENDSNSTEIVADGPRTRFKITTKHGEMIFELFNETPKHKENFIKLVKDSFYNDIMIHRVQQNFMIQAGDPDSRGEVKPEQFLGNGTLGYTIPAEINSKFIMQQGALVAYHSGIKNNKKKASNSSQFMVIHGQPLHRYQLQKASQQNGVQYTEEQIKCYERFGGTPTMDGNYTIFGQMIKGEYTLNKLVKRPTFRMQEATGPDRPVEDVRMSIELIEES